MTTRLFLPWSLLAGLLAVVVAVDGLKATALVLGKVKPKSTEAPPTDTPAEELQEGESTELPVNGSTRSPLTGIPQIDYIHDPNLPRELNGYNLTDYPFYDRVPEDLDFKCDGLHDGFYASVLHKCQVYHHCLFGTRYDFLCANYTAFDQKTFICHFVSEVDCENSPKYFIRNEALYKATTSSTTTTTTTTQAPPPPPPPPPPPARRPQGGGRRRPYRRRRPVYEYYYDDEEYDDADYYDDELPATGKDLAPSGPGRHNRNRPRRPLPPDEPERRPSRTDDLEPATAGERKVEPKSRPASSVYDRPRVPPKIRRPVPKSERDKYDYNSQPRAQSSTAGSAEDQDYSRPSQQPPPKAAPASKEPDDADYYDDDEEEEYVPPARPSAGSSRNRNPDYYPPTAERELRRPSSSAGRHVRRRGPGGRRRYVGQVESATPYAPLSDEDYDDEELPRRPVRPSGSGGRRRVQTSYPDAYSPQQSQRPYATQQRSSGSQASKYKYSEEEVIDEEPVPAPRPAYISPTAGGRQNFMSHKRNQQSQQQPEVLYDEYSGTQSKSPPSGSGGYRRQETKKSTTTVAPRVPSGYAADLLDEDYYDDEEIEEDVVPSYNPHSRQSSKDGNPPTYSSSSSGENTGRQTAYNKRPAPQSSRVPIISQPRSPQAQPGRIPATASQKSENISPALPDQSARKNYYEDDSSEHTVSNYRPKSKLTYVEEQPASSTRNISPPSGNPTTGNKNPSTGEAEKSNKTEKEAPSGAPSRGPSQTYSNFRSKGSFTGPNSRNAEARYQDNVETIPKAAGGAPSSSQYPSAPEGTAGGNKNSANNPRFAGADTAPLPSSSHQAKGNQGVRIPSKVVIKPIDRDVRIQNVLADLNEQDIDVTINDALHPTLHPTRSITSGFVPQTQEETQSGPSTLNKRVPGQRYQAQLPSGSRGSVSYLTSSASQRYITRTPFNINSNERLESGTNIYVSHDQNTGSGGNVQYPVPSVVSERPNFRHRQKDIPLQPLPSGPLDYRSTQTKQQQGPLYSQQRDSSAEYYSTY